jgi:hypothetical protein
MGLVAHEIGVHDARSPGVGEKFIPVADQGPGGDGKFDAHPSGTGVGEVHHFPFAHGKLFGYHPHEGFVAVDEEPFDGLFDDPVLLLQDHFRPAHTKFKAFPAHGFDEDGQLKFAAALDQDMVPVLGGFHLDGHIEQGLFQQAFPNFCRLHIAAFFAAQRTVIDVNSMETVGGSTVMRGRAKGASSVQMVSPMVTSSMPDRMAISPAPTEETG